MNKLRILFFATLLASSLHAQNITGTWQGTLEPGATSC
jgi:hypothetical protein